MDKTLQVQAQIRQNAEGISSALSDMSKWEKQIKVKDKKIIENTAIKGKLPVRSGVGTVPIKSVVASQTNKKVVDLDEAQTLTPSSIVNLTTKGSSAKPTSNVVAKARGLYVDVDPEEAERERGNTEFKNGNFTAAVKSYTKCLGLKSKNYVAFSNRAMAYLKLKEFNRAVTDCNGALSIDPQHVKSLLRRATGYNALGKHRAALKNLLYAMEIEPGSKQVRSELQMTKELLRSAVNRAPYITMHVHFDDLEGSDESGLLLPLQGPDPAPEVKENSSILNENSTLSEFLKPKPSTTTTTTTSVASSSSRVASKSPHRVTIVEESDDEDEVVRAPEPFTETQKPVVSKPIGGGSSSRIVIVESDDDEDDAPLAHGVETSPPPEPSALARLVAPKIVPTASVNVSAPVDGMHRITIVDEDESGDEEEKIVQVKAAAPAAVKKSTTKKDTTTVNNTKTNSKTTSKSTTAAKDTPTKSPKKTSKLVEFTAYGLENALLQAGTKISALETVFARVTLKSLPNLIQNIEPDGLFLLFKGANTLFLHEKTRDFDANLKLFAYLECIANIERTHLLLNLMNEKSEVLHYVTSCVNVLCNDVNTTEEVRVRAKQVLDKYQI